jgi:hypothetical protein
MAAQGLAAILRDARKSALLQDEVWLPFRSMRRPINPLPELAAAAIRQGRGFETCQTCA